MIWPIILAVLFLAAKYVLTYRLLQRRSAFWSATAGISLAVGVAAGVWIGFVRRYASSDRVEIIGFPIPLLIFQWEDGRWIDYVGNPLFGFVNLFLVASGFLLPVLVGLLAATLGRRRPGRP